MTIERPGQGGANVPALPHEDYHEAALPPKEEHTGPPRDDPETPPPEEGEWQNQAEA
jgi:hypothetical protein